MIRIVRALVILLLTVAIMQASNACPACYGAKDSPMTAGMNTAILVMLGITGMVLATIAGAALYFWRRAHRRRAENSDTLFVNEDGQLYVTKVKGIPEWNNF